LGQCALTAKQLRERRMVDRKEFGKRSERILRIAGTAAPEFLLEIKAETTGRGGLQRGREEVRFHAVNVAVARSSIQDSTKQSGAKRLPHIEIHPGECSVAARCASG